jgi:invasion protein IalB
MAEEMADRSPSDWEEESGRRRSRNAPRDYDEPEERRSRLVPILSIVAALLAIAIGVAAVLFFFGVFDRKQSAPATAATEQPAQPLDLTPDTPQTEKPLAQPAPASDVPKAVVSVAPPAPGEPPVRSTHGDWQIRCDTPAGAQAEQCVLMQFVTAEDRDNVGLTVIILKTADKKARIMRVLAPLGVLLPSGLGLKVDDTDMGRAGFVRCLPNGCVAEVILEDKLLDKLKTGKTATFVIFQTPEEGIGIPISLSGFGPGYDTLP